MAYEVIHKNGSKAIMQINHAGSTTNIEVTEGYDNVGPSAPVILTGGITEVEAAEELISSDKADLIGVGRAALKDSMWAKNAIESIE